LLSILGGLCRGSSGLLETVEKFFGSMIILQSLVHNPLVGFSTKSNGFSWRDIIGHWDEM
jgi:hypothetical protein